MVAACVRVEAGGAKRREGLRAKGRIYEPEIDWRGSRA